MLPNEEIENNDANGVKLERSSIIYYVNARELLHLDFNATSSYIEEMRYNFLLKCTIIVLK